MTESAGFESTHISEGGVLLSSRHIEDIVVTILRSNIIVELELFNINHVAGNGDDAAKILAEVFKIVTLEKFCFRGSKVGNEGVRYMVEGLQNNMNLLHIDLRWNCIGDSGAKYIGEFLKLNDGVTTFLLGGNKIGSMGIAFLADALEINQTLTHLDLWNNKIDENGLEHLARALRTNRTLITLEKTEVYTEKKMIEEKIDAAIDRNRNCRRIKLRNFEDVLGSDANASWNRSRLMLVGQGKAGKTATARSLLNLTFDSGWVSTIGADVLETETTRTGKWFSKTVKENNAAKLAVRILNESKPNVKQTREDPEDVDGLPPGDSLTAIRASIPQTFVPTNGRWREANFPKQTKKKNLNDKMKKKERSRAREFDEKLFLNSNSLMLSLWDFGGQEVFYSMHHIFLTETGVYALVFDMRELLLSDKRRECSRYILFWLRSVKLHAPASSILIVGTFTNTVLQQEGSDGLKTIDGLLRDLVKENFPQIFSNKLDDLLFFPIDNSESIGIETVRSAIEEVVRNDESIGVKVSIRWLNLLDMLLEKRDNAAYLNLAAVKSLAAETGIIGTLELGQALKLFHERGMIIHLTATQVLKDIITIKPQWLIDNLSKVIRDGKLHQFDTDEINKLGLERDVAMVFEEGKATNDFFEYIWGKEHLNFFLDLMRQAMLLSDWDISKQQQTYIIPSLLRNKWEPTGEHIGIQCIFEFEFLPIGVFQRLISLCILQSSRQKAQKDAMVKLEPDLYSNFGAIELEPGFVLRLHLQEQGCTLTGSQAIIACFHDSKYARKGYNVITAMLNKINFDVMRSGLTWNVLFESQSSDDLISLSTARIQKIYPWFDGKDDEKTQITPTNVDIASFLDMLWFD